MHLTNREFPCKINKYDIVDIFPQILKKAKVLMKKTNKKWITLLLSGMLGVAALGAGLLKTDVVSADETGTSTAKTYALTGIFASDATGVIGAAKKEEDATAETAKFTLSQGENVEFRRNLALKWYEDGEVKYFTMKFSLADTNFDALSIVMESESATANEDNKATNKLTFKKVATEGKISVSVNGTSEMEIDAAEQYTLTLSETEGADYGTFDVVLNGNKVGEFTNIGANYAAYTSGKVIPLAIASEKEGDQKTREGETAEDTVVYLLELNNQKFDNIVTENNVKKVPDTAAPVIVINEDIADSLLLGTAFSYYSPTVLDVMPNSNAKISTRSFYQWNPTDTEVKYSTDMKSSHYFMETTYYSAEDGSAFATRTEANESGKNFKATTVYKENDEEYLSVKYSVKDDSNNTCEYQLVWYADDNAKKSIGEDENAVDYVKLKRNNEGATYNYITLDDENKENVVSSDLAAAVAGYQVALETAAKEAVAGSNSYIYFPSFSWLINDNNGYRNLKFVICYKSASAPNGKSTSPLNYNGLRLSTSDEGYYEFKVLATDAAGNGMYYYLNRELVKVTSSNIWDIEDIPSFSYTIERKGVSIKADSDIASKRKDNVEFNGKFSGFSDPTVVGMTSKKSAYALYKVDTSIFNEGLDSISDKLLTVGVLTGVTYATLKQDIDAEFEAGRIPAQGEYFDFYLKLYVERLATALDVAGNEERKQKLEECFIAIDEYDETITEEDAAWETNKFKWNASNKSFEAVEECEYLIFADYYEKDLATQRVAAYKVIEVEAEEDVNYIKTQWIKENITSVVLFAIAGVMLVMIIILLLVKPSDETLEDVEEAADEQDSKKKGKKSRK